MCMNGGRELTDFEKRFMKLIAEKPLTEEQDEDIISESDETVSQS